MYEREIGEMNGFLVFGLYVEGEVGYMMGVGEGSDIGGVIEVLMEDGKSEGGGLGLVGVCVNMGGEVENGLGDGFNFVWEGD